MKKHDRAVLDTSHDPGGEDAGAFVVVIGRWRDRAPGDRSRTMVLSGESGVEFLRRFLLPVLPSGFPRIRHHGLLGNRGRALRLAACRLALGATMPAPPTVDAAPGPAPEARCPACGTGLVRREFTFASAPAILDSS